MTIAEDLRTFIAHVMRRVIYLGIYEYVVKEQRGDRLDVDPIGDSPKLPDGPYLDKTHGVAGASEVCIPGSIVLVGFLGGSPGSPRIVGYLPSRATSITLDADAVQVGEAPRQRVAREGDAVRVDAAIVGSPAIPGGCLLFNVGLQAIQVVAPGTPGSVELSAVIVEGSDVLSTK